MVLGMPVILTQNIAIELGLINGTIGVFRQLVYEGNSVANTNLSEEFPQSVEYVHQTIYALIENNKPKLECQQTDPESNFVSKPLMEQTFQINVNDILPKEKNSKQGNQPILLIKRRPLPLVPAYCITTHKSRGQILGKVVIDLKLSNDTDDITAVYVPLFRVK